jgi:hypothetical protein
MAAMMAFQNPPATPVASPGARSAASIRARLVPPMSGSTLLGWAGPLLVTLFGGFLRFYRLGVPHAVVFDETYYVGDAYGILKHGVEINHLPNADAVLARGGTNILGSGGELVVHRPDAVRVAVHRGGGRVAGHPDGRQDHPADDPLHAARLRGRAADVAGRA